MKIRPIDIRDAASAAYQSAMVILKRTTWRRPVSTEQAESTKAILEGRTDPNRPMPENWKAEATGTFVEDPLDLLVGRRPISLEELIPFKANQMRRGVESVGQPELGLDDERRERAAEAFMSAPGTGKRWTQLSEAEKKRVKSYFLDSVLGRNATAEEVRALYSVEENAAKVIDRALEVKDEV